MRSSIAPGFAPKVVKRLRRTLSENGMGCAPGMAFGLLNWAKPEPRAEPAVPSWTIGEAKPRRTSGGRADSEGLLTQSHRTLIRKIILLLAPLAAVFVASPVDYGIAQKKQDETRSVMTWEHSDDGWRVKNKQIG